MRGLKDKTALVTGAARGMGNATARRLAEEDVKVYMVDLPGEELEHSMDDFGRRDNILLLPCDVSDEAQVKEAARKVRSKEGSIDFLINIAGINVFSTIDKMPLPDWNRIFAVNVTGTMLMMKHFSPFLRDEAGSIVNMGSVSAHIGSDYGSAYSMTKGAVISLSQAIAQELSSRGIRVNAVAPGWVDTAFTDQGVNRTENPEQLRAYADSLHLKGRIARVEEVASSIAFLLSDEASFITGQTLYVDGGFMVKR